MALARSSSGISEPDDRARRGRLAADLAVSPGRLAGLDPDLLEAIERRLWELREAAAVDELTGALRRAAGLAALEREVRRAHRFEDRKLVVAFVDVDGLKTVNDTCGHAAGDAVLRELAATLRRRLRAYDLVIRWGGDEFVCSLPGAGVEPARRALEDIRTELVARTGCTFSAGFAELGADGDGESLVARADADYYERRRCQGGRRGTRSPRLTHLGELGRAAPQGAGPRLGGAGNG